MGPAGAKSKILALWWTKARQVGGLTGKCMDQCRKIRNLSSVKGHMSRWYTKLVPYIMDINAMAFSSTLSVIKQKRKVNLPYHLTGYNSKIASLSNQAKSILEFCISNRDIEDFKRRIDQESKLEQETIQILKKAILAGYDSSIYTYNWTNEQEVKLWELINAKCDEEYKVYFILANIQIRNKSAYELKDLYFKAFNQKIDYIYSLEDSIKEQLYENIETRYELLRYEFEARVTRWDDFEDNWNDGQPWIKKFGTDKKAMEIMNQMLTEKRKRTDNNV
jgi:hypothetical protein